MLKKEYSLLFIILIFTLFSCRQEEPDFEDIFGVQVTDLMLQDEHGDYFGYFGEGYSGFVYSISGSEMEAILNNVRSLDLPIKKEPLSKMNWTETPIKDNQLEVKELSSNYYTKNGNFLEFQQNVEIALEKEGKNYYCYYYRKTEGNIIEIELYVLDVDENKIYIVKNSI